MAAFTRRYFTYIIDAMLACGITYGRLETCYNAIYAEDHKQKLFEQEEKIRSYKAVGRKFVPKEITQDSVTEQSIRDAHKRSDRGNMPKNISPEEYYDSVIRSLIKPKNLPDFAKIVVDLLSADRRFPKSWKDRIDDLTAEGEGFNEDLFCEFLVFLMCCDKDKITDDDDTSEQGGADEESALAFSKRFFGMGALGIADAKTDVFEDALRGLSNLFKDVCSIEFKKKNDSVKRDETLIEELSSWVVRSLKTSKNKEVLKIKGPLGSYKNRLIQYLYLALERKADFFTPFYIDVAVYERAAEGNEGIDEKDFLAAFEKDIKKAEKIISKSKGKIPLLLLDGIRDFSCRNESLYYAIDERIQKHGWYLIVCMDTDFTVNNQNKYDVHPLVSNNFDGYLRMRSMNLNKKKESIEFIRNCINVFGVPLSEDISVEEIYDNLIRMNFLSVDAYWLTHILRSHLNDIINENNDIAGLYNAISLSFLGTHKAVKSAAEFAYEFEYGKCDFESTNPYFDSRWRFIREHRSVLEFLIAKEYVRRITGIKLEKDNESFNKRQLKIFEMVLQEYISRFVYPMLKNNENYEHKILHIAKKHHHELSIIGKSELSFRMTGLYNTRRRLESLALIREYNEILKKEYAKNPTADIREKINVAFLLRSYNINLIYHNDRKAFIYFSDLLLTKKLFNKINRGFQLEFYGDKPYIPNQSLLDFEDNTAKGFNTFNRLCVLIDNWIANPNGKIYAAAIEIMSFCSLLQARMVDSGERVFDILPFAKKCMDYIDWITTCHKIESIEHVVSYFNCMHEELDNFVNRGVRFNRANVFNQLSAKQNGGGTTEHTYGCWLMGTLYLPNAYDEEGYDKNAILQMLLLHDLWKKSSLSADELLTDDTYESPEQSIMQSVFFSGTYPISVDLSGQAKVWNEWDKQNGINYLVAKDIDSIQTTYQFCASRLDGISEEKKIYVLEDLEYLETDIGREIAEILIIENPIFKTLLNV